MFRLERLTWLVLMLSGSPQFAQGQPKDKPTLVLNSGGHIAPVRGLAFTPDGRELLSTSEDKTIRVWDVRTGEQIRVLRPPIGKGPIGKLFAAALSPDGRHLAVTTFGLPGMAGEPDFVVPVLIVRTDDGQIERRLLDGRSSGWVAFSPDGQWLAVGCNDQAVRLWNCNKWTSARVFRHDGRAPNGVVFRPDSKRLAVNWAGSGGVIYTVPKGDIAAKLPVPNAGGNILWSPDGKTIALADSAHQLHLWSPDGSLLSRQKHPAEGPRAFFPDSRKLIALNYPQSQVLDLTTGKAISVNAWHANTPLSAAVSRDGELMAVGDLTGEILLAKTTDGSLVHRLGKTLRTMAAAWSADSQSIAWAHEADGAAFPENTRVLTRSFRSGELEFGDRPDASYVRGKTRLGTTWLDTSKAQTVQVKRGDKLVGEFKAPDGGQLICCTLAPENRLVMGTLWNLAMYDIGTRKLHYFVGHTSILEAVAPSPDGRFLLSASNDQTLRIWTFDREEPLLSLFFAGDEWIAWTTEGYYAASPGGEKLMGWHVNNGLDKMANFYPAAQFRSSFYRPDVIKLLLRTGSVARALEIANQPRGIKSGPTDVADVLPPKVRLVAPAKDLQVRDAALEVRARASSTGKHPVSAMQLLIDGRPLMGHGGLVRVEAPKLGDVEASWNIALTPGKHRLTVRAESAVSSGLSDDVEVVYLAPDPAEQAKLPALYILAVGISEYPGKLKLNYAARDAQTLARAFERHSKSLFARIEVKELTDQKATQREILKGITWLSKHMTQRDVAVVFLAGHGEIANNGAFYFLPADVDPEDIPATGVHAEQIKATLAALPGRVMLLLDACHAGAAGKAKRRAGGALTDDLIRDLAADERGIIVICASTGRQFSLESDQHQHGMFTLALVEGLQGKAKRVGGEVYLHHLDAYVTDRVRELSRGEQSPTMARPASIRSFALSRP